MPAVGEIMRCSAVVRPIVDHRDSDTRSTCTVLKVIDHGSVCGIFFSATKALDHTSSMGLLVLWDMLLVEVPFDLDE